MRADRHHTFNYRCEDAYMNYTMYAYFKFLTELVVATALFVYPLKRRKLFLLRLVLCLLCCYGFSRIYSYELSRIFIYAVFRYIMLFSMVCLTVFACFDMKLIAAVSCGISAYCVQFATNRLYVFVEYMLLQDFALWIMVLIYCASYAVSYTLLFVLFGRRLNMRLVIEIERLELMLCYISLIIVTVIINVIINNYVGELNVWGELVIAIYGILCAVFILGLQAGIFRRSTLKSEMREMKHIWDIERRQMEISKANMDLINVKCHDIKNMLLSYNHSISSDDMREMQALISVYDMSVKTGNPTLDLIIAEKSLYMQQQKITFTCMVDGAAINFMRPSDIYSLFGNALNNAVEAAEKVADESKRVISLNIKRVFGVVSVHMENYFEGQIEYSGTRPKTSKRGEEGYHGFGTRSIELITEKYGGGLSARAEGQIYKLDIAFIVDGTKERKDVEYSNS